MSELPTWSYLEKFRDPRFPFVHWVDDNLASTQAINDVSSAGPFGLETGFGQQLTKLFLVNPNINWLSTELNEKDFNIAKGDLSACWRGVVTETIPPEFRMIALRAVSTQRMVTQAQVLVYRNLDYRDMWIPTFDGLRKGQRLFFIVDEAHVGELSYYRRFLSEQGYNPLDLKLRSPELTTLSAAYPGNEHTYVLDLVKE